MSFKKIIAAVDFSEFSEKAVDYAIFLAQHFNARLTLLHAVVTRREYIEESFSLPEYEDFLSAAVEQSRERLTPYLKKAASNGVKADVKVSQYILPADAILDFIRENEDYDLIVMGTHGRSGLKKWVYGSVAEKVVRLSPIPVLTVHHEMETPAINKILLPVDFSDFSKNAVAFARPIAKKFNASIDFLHVIEQKMHPAYYAGGVESIFEADPGLQERSTKRLQEFVPYHPKNAQYAVEEGDAYKKIVEYAKTNGVDLIIMATRGVTGLEHLLVGSTAERVVQLAPCAVLTVERN